MRETKGGIQENCDGWDRVYHWEGGNANDNKNARDATVITAVATQPRMVHQPDILNLPMSFALVPRRISSAITGTATIALSTADQMSALTGPIDNMFSAAPTKVATIMAA